MSETIDDTITVLLRASEVLKRWIQTDRELRTRIESQAAQIKVALGYLRAGQPELAAIVLKNEPEVSEVVMDCMRIANAKRETGDGESVEGPTAEQCDDIIGKKHYSEREGA